MILKELIEGLPESEMLYIGMKNASGFAFIKRIRDCDWKQMDKMLKRWLNERKRRTKAQVKEYIKNITVDSGYVEYLKIREASLSEYKFKKLLNRKICDTYAQSYDEPHGTIVILEGCEGIGGFWFEHEQRNGIDRGKEDDK